MILNFPEKGTGRSKYLQTRSLGRLGLRDLALFPRRQQLYALRYSLNEAVVLRKRVRRRRSPTSHVFTTYLVDLRLIGQRPGMRGAACFLADPAIR
ncbi:MAG: hypothetical protein ABIP75_08030 [Pyrinomonadaceae bacterium]